MAYTQQRQQHREQDEPGAVKTAIKITQEDCAAVARSRFSV
jgi:hypothetical protein